MKGATMRRLVLLSCCAIGVAALGVGASSAFGLSFEKAEFLVGGSPAITGETVLAEGEVLLEDSKLGIAVVCSGMVNGHFEGDEKVVITEVLSLGGTKVGELTTEGSLCKAGKGRAENGDLDLFPLNLPAVGIAVLDTEDGKPWALGGNGVSAPGYEIKCLILGISTEETCTAAEGSGGEVVNAAGGIEVPAGTTDGPNGNCTVGG